MEKFLKRQWILVLLAIASGSVYGQHTSLKLEDALVYAIETSHLAKQAQLEVENSDYKINEVKSRALPQITGTGSLTYNPLLQKSALPGEIVGQPGQTIMVAFGQKWNSGANVTLTQNLFDQSVFTGLKAAKSTREYYKIYAQLTEEQLIEQVATTYYQVLIQKQKIVVVDSTIHNTENVLSVIKGLYESGLARQIDVDRLEVSLSNLKTQKIQLNNLVTQYENQLKYAMGMEIQTPITLQEIDFDNLFTEGIAEILQPDINTRTEIKLLNQQKQLLELQKQAYKAEYVPTLSLNANYGYQGLGNSFPIFKGTSSGVNWFDYSSVGLSLRIPIFNGFATKARVRQADVALRSIQEEIAQTGLSLNLQYENAKAQISNSLLTLESQEKNMELARKVYFNTQNNYNNGLAPLTDLLDAEKSQTEAQNNYLEALLNFKVAEIQLLKSQGNLQSLLKK